VSVAPDEAALAELRRSVAALEPELRRELARAWQRAAQLEHASIASFARFSLQLLSVAAPAQLVAAAHVAALDELRHAQLCFGLASVYAGVALGPAPLALEPGVFELPDLAAVIEATVVEGCIGETLAAAEAQAASASAESAALRDVLSTIARDEGEHASLAFRCVAWALGVAGDPLRGRVRLAFERGLEAEVAVGIDAHADTRWEAHGRLTLARRRAIHAQVRQELLLPALRELFDG
jgi:hypothetical protein